MSPLEPSEVDHDVPDMRISAHPLLQLSFEEFLRSFEIRPANVENLANYQFKPLHSETVLGFLNYMGGSLCNTKMTCMEHTKCICWVRPRGSAAVDANPTLLFRKLVRWLSQGIGATKEDHQEAGRLLKSSYCMNV